MHGGTKHTLHHHGNQCSELAIQILFLLQEGKIGVIKREEYFVSRVISQCPRKQGRIWRKRLAKLTEATSDGALPTS